MLELTVMTIVGILAVGAIIWILIRSIKGKNICSACTSARGCKYFKREAGNRNMNNCK